VILFVFLQLENGQLITTSAYLVKRQKQHFHHLEQYGVDMILGLNDYIWVGVHTDVKNLEGQGEEENGSEKSTKSIVKSSGDATDGKKDSTSLRVRENICRLANAIHVLSSLGFSLSLELILDTFQTSIDWNIDIKDMLAGEFYVRIAEREAERRSSKSNV
jgi:exosome complex component RRP4